MKVLFFLPLCLTSFFVSIAQETGVRFEGSMNWQQILDKAKSENKYIFIDCFTTWCGPCKNMDKDTYPDKEVGNVFNKQFISVRLQMDTTQSDEERVKEWYAFANRVGQQYSINAYPTYLFFSSEGKIVHKWGGYQGPKEMMALAKEALDTNGQYYTLLERFRSNCLPDSLVPFLAMKASSLYQPRVADSVASGYINRLLTLEKDQRFAPINLVFIERFTQNISDEGFAFFSNNRRIIDSIMGAGRASRFLIKVIVKGRVEPALKGKQIGGAEWKNLKEKFGKEYGKEGQIAVAQYRLFSDWSDKKDWVDLGNAYIDYFQLAGNLAVFNVNNISWDVFLHVKNRKILQFALNLMESYKNEDADSMDTYANLLYKIGRTEDAIVWEKKALEYKKTFALQRHEIMNDSDNVLTLERMRKGEKTWSE